MPTVAEKQRVRDKIFNDVYPFTSDTIQCYAYPYECQDIRVNDKFIMIGLTTDKMEKTDYDYLIAGTKPINDYIPYSFEFQEILNETEFNKKYKDIELGQRYSVTININPNAEGSVSFQVADKEDLKNADIIFN